MNLVLLLAVAQIQAAYAPSVIGAKPVADGENSVAVAAGFSALGSVEYRRGLERFDLGVRGSFVRGVEGVLVSYAGSDLILAPGGRVQALFRVRLIDAHPWSFGLAFEPGLTVLAVTSSTLVRSTSTLIGLNLPLDARLTVEASKHLWLTFSFGAPVFLGLNSGPAVVPVQLGLGAEYAFDNGLVFFARARGGVSVVFGPAVSVDLQVGVAFSL